MVFLLFSAAGLNGALPVRFEARVVSPGQDGQFVWDTVMHGPIVGAVFRF